jgi:hypothetical protein
VKPSSNESLVAKNYQIKKHKTHILV